MHELKITASGGKREFYAELRVQLAALLEGETDLIANTANMASLLYHALPDVNWAGFYFLKGGELVLGPFHGKPACVRIAMGKGVCGSAAAARKSLLVEDVHAFPGHIACGSFRRTQSWTTRGHRHGTTGPRPCLTPRRSCFHLLTRSFP